MTLNDARIVRRVGALPKADQAKVVAAVRVFLAQRSEEHTSELQSQSNLVCRLLLEKKKKSQNQTQHRGKKAVPAPVAPAHSERFRSLPSSWSPYPNAQKPLSRDFTTRYHHADSLYC